VTTAIRLSAVTSTLPNVEADEFVDPGDAAVQALLAFTAENTGDPAKRDLLIDAILTLPPLEDWPAESLQKLIETGRFVIGLAEDLRQKRAQTFDVGQDPHSRLQTRRKPDEHEHHDGGP
jgi:hypothetical protein